MSVNQRQIVCYEALIRGPSNSPLHSPMNLFDTDAHLIYKPDWSLYVGKRQFAASRK
ncbi:MAG: hypothetical protein ACR65O_10905 [Methylomicrobium sp.]